MPGLWQWARVAGSGEPEGVMEAIAAFFPQVLRRAIAIALRPDLGHG
ncbi:hypothetical protein [Laspinema palackyanum]|nr:hypothetical protein [Laspinema sp. D2c]